MYESNLDFLYTSEVDLKKFNFTICLKEFNFRQQDIHKQTFNGVFKNYMNLEKFQKQSGIFGQTDSAYWEFEIK